MIRPIRSWAVSIVAALHVLIVPGAGFAMGPACPGDGPSTGFVIVALDLDPSEPGFQTSLQIVPGTESVGGIAVWIYDPDERAIIYSVGYVGGLNRGIALGHVPEIEQNQGQVTALTATTVEPIIPGHTAFVNNGIEELFAGPEVQYFEYGPTPSTISACPANPVMTLEIEFTGATHGDIFYFYLGDMTAVWIAGWSLGIDGGAFSTTGLATLDAGGDAIPDGTVTMAGIDADVPAPAPPAPFLVEYLDSPDGGGGATIEVLAAPGDFDLDGDLDLDDHAHFPACMTGPASGTIDPGCEAFDFNQNGTTDLFDFGSFTNDFTGSLP